MSEFQKAKPYASNPIPNPNPLSLLLSRWFLLGRCLLDRLLRCRLLLRSCFLGRLLGCRLLLRCRLLGRSFFTSRSFSGGWLLRRCFLGRSLLWSRFLGCNFLWCWFRSRFGSRFFRSRLLY